MLGRHSEHFRHFFFRDVPLPPGVTLKTFFEREHNGFGKTPGLSHLNFS